MALFGSPIPALRRVIAMFLVAVTLATAMVAIEPIANGLLGIAGDAAVAAPPPTSIALATDKSVFPAGQYPILTATTDLNVANSGTVITITDQTTGSVIKTCTIGTSCSVAAQWFTGGPHTFIANVGSLTSNTVVVTRTAWTLSLTTNYSSLPAGQRVELLATANQNVGSTNSSYRIYIFDAVSGALVVSCATSNLCGANITTFYSGGPRSYTAVVAASGTPTLATVTDVQATSGQVTVSRQPWTLTLTTNKSSFAAGESVTLTATANQNVGGTGGTYRFYIFDQTTGAILAQCTTNTTCALSSTSLIQTGPPHDYIAFVAKGGATSIATMQDIQATSNVVTVARQTWTVTLSTNTTEFSVGQPVQLTATANQSTGGSYRIYVFDKTTNTLVGSCTSGTVCTVSVTGFTTGGPRSYAAVVAPVGTYANIGAVSSPEATSNDVTVARAPWTVSVTMTNTSFATNSSPSFLITMNQTLSGSGLSAFVFDTTAGTRASSCSSGTYCALAGGGFLTGGPHDYVVVIGSSNSSAQTPTQVSNIQATFDGLSASRKQWTVSIWFGDFQLGGNVILRAGANQFENSSYNRYIVDETLRVVIQVNSPSNTFQHYFTVKRNTGHVYRSYIASTSKITWPLVDIQAISGPLMAVDPAPTLDGETTGGVNASEKSAQCSHADPVNSATGEFFLPATDMSISGAGPSLTVGRTYSTKKSSVDGPFGFGWSANFSAQLKTVIAGDSVDPLPRQVQVVQENGATVLFAQVTDGSYVAAPRVLSKLRFDQATQTWIFTRDAQLVMVFNLSGTLLEIRDLHGNAVVIGYDSSNRVVGMSASGGRSFSFTWTGNHVTGISDSAGRSVSYGYDASGNLTAATGMDGRVSTYLYDSGHYMTRLTAPGGASTYNTYDSPQRRVVSQTDPLNRVTTFSYGATTTITAPDGSQIVETYSNGALLTQTKAATLSCAATTGYSYDSYGNMTSSTDALGKVTTFTYDADGNVVSRADPLNRTTRWTYNADRKPTSVTDPMGRVTTMTYNSASDMVSMTAPNLRVTSWTFNASGTVATMTSPTGGVTQYAYDAAGRLTSATDADARTTSLGYNAAGIVTQQTAPDGQSTVLTTDAIGRTLTSTDPNGRVVQYAYDAAGNLTTVTNPNGDATSSAFDAAGQVTSTTDAAGKITRYTYTAAGQLATVTDANAHATTTAYNALGQVTSTTDANGRVSSYTYDGAGRPLSTTLPSGAVSTVTYDAAGQVTASTDALGQVTAFAYNLAGQLLSSTDPLGRVTTSTYNADGLPSTITLPGGSTQVYAYSADGQPTTFTNADGKVTSYAYSSAGRLLGKTEPGGLVTGYTYDAAGRPSVVTLPDGSTTTYSYDLAGQVTGVHYSAAGSTDTTYTYDLSGRPLTMADATGTSSFGYDVVGRLTSETNGAGATTGYGYDDVGQLTSITYPGNRAVSYVYDAAGQMTSLTDWSNRTTSFGWTANGQLASQADPNGVTQANAYDATGQLTGITTSGTAGVLASFAYGYDAAGQLIGTDTLLNGSTVDHDYGYDPLSQLASVVETPGAGAASSTPVVASPAGLLTSSVRGATLSYNAAQQVTSMVPVVGPETAFGFDARGSRTSSTVAATQYEPSKTSSFAYTPSGALASVVTPTVTVAYTSDARNLRQSRTVGGVTEQFTWSSVGGLPLLLDDREHSYLYGPSSSPLAQVDDTTGDIEYLHADSLGTPRLVTDGVGAVVGSVSFDAFGNRATYTGAQSAFGFTGNWTDPDTGLLYLRARDYDPVTGQFLTVDPAVDSTRQPYAYTGNSPVSRTDPSGLDWQDEVAAFGLGALDGATMGASSMLLSAFVPGYDCFIQQHNTAFQVGSVVTQVVVAVVTIVATAGAGTVLVAARYAAQLGVRAALKTSAKAAAQQVRQSTASAVRTLRGGADNTFGAAGSRSASLSPSSIRFSQSSVNGVENIATSMRSNGWVGDAIDVVRMPDGGLTAIDNTRVLAAHQANITARAVIREFDALLPQNLIGRFTTPRGGVPSTWGDAIMNRIGGQSSTFRNVYPLGSPLTGWGGS